MPRKSEQFNAIQLVAQDAVSVFMHGARRLGYVGDKEALTPDERKLLELQLTLNLRVFKKQLRTNTMMVPAGESAHRGTSFLYDMDVLVYNTALALTARFLDEFNLDVAKNVQEGFIGVTVSHIEAFLKTTHRLKHGEKETDETDS